MSERRSGADARPWLGLSTRTAVAEPTTDADATTVDASPDDTTQHLLPPERPFAGDDIDTLELLRDNAERREVTRRRLRRIGIAVVVALVAVSAGTIIERIIGAL